MMNAVRTIRRELKGEVPLSVFPAARGRWRPTWWKAAAESVHRDQKNDVCRSAGAARSLDKLAKSVTLYLNAQIKAGARQ